MIRLEKLSKSFKGKPALHEFSLEVAKGEIFGLLGHNGAGKSTSFGIMLGQVYPDGGEAIIGGISVQRDRSRALSRVGAIFETPGFYEYMSGWANLRVFTSYSDRVSAAALREAVEIVDLTRRIHDPVRTYSHGMRQRLALAQALLPSPEVILLDEPTEGLDPEGIHEMRDLIRRLNRERGLTVLLSSHLLAEVEQLCDRVAILNQGRLIYAGRWSELAARDALYHVETDDWPRTAAVAAAAGFRVVGEGLVRSDSAPKDVAELAHAIVSAGLKLRALEPQRRNLETLYLDLTRGGEIPAESSAAMVLPPASERPPSSAANESRPAARGLFFTQLGLELRKLFARKRTYIGFGAFLFVELLALALFQLPKAQQSMRRLIEGMGYGFEEYFSGLTLAFIVLTLTILLLGALYLALVSGDVVSKEVEEGTLRMTLCRPVSRLRLLAVKYCACVIYTFALIIFIGLSALGMGLLRQGSGGMFVFSPEEQIYALYDFWPGLVRYLSALPLLGLSLLSVTSLGFSLSCLNMKPAAATIIALTYMFVDMIFVRIPYFESVKGWFITKHMSAWVHVFEMRIPWQDMAFDYAYLLGFNATLVILAALAFQQRDFKS